MKHKNTSKAVIYNHDYSYILLLEKKLPDGTLHYTLPGGVPDPGETLIDALHRECHEEINCTPEVIRLLYVCEFDKPTEDETRKNRRIEFGFLCTVPDGYLPQMGQIPDKHQTAVTWVKIEKLDALSFIPSGIEQVISKRSDTESCYLGFCPYTR